MTNKKLTIFEFTIISFFLAVVISTIIMFVSWQGNSYSLSFPLNYITLSFLVDKVGIDSKYEMAIRFVYYILVLTIYGLLLAIINKYSNKIKYLSILFVATLSFLIFQESSIARVSDSISNNYPTISTASVIKSVPSAPKKYFGLEARGDINSDGVDDIAFIIKRKDEVRGDLYYLSASLGVDDGYEGLNLIFLGNGEIPYQIIIEEGVIGVDLGKKIFYAQLIDNEIRELIY